MSNNDMLGKLVKLIIGLPAEVIGTLYDLVEKLRGKEGGVWLTGLKRFLRKENSWGAVVSALLDFIETVDLPAIGKFIVSDHFTVINKEVKIGYIGDNFENNFVGKVEEAQAKATLCISKLKKDSLDTPIMDELGSMTETTLANVWQLLKKQANGEKGKLLTNGYANIFYVRDTKGVFWVVFVRWLSGDWSVGARSVGHLVEWGECSQVFSRKRVVYPQSRFGEGLY